MTRRSSLSSHYMQRTEIGKALLLGLLLSVSSAALAQTAVKKEPTVVANANPAPTVESSVVARAGNYRLTREEVRDFVKSLSEKDQSALAADPALFSQSLRILLANRLVLEEAFAKSWNKEPAVVTQLKRVSDNVIVESYLQSTSEPPAGYPSEAQLKAAYESAKSSLMVPRQFQVAHIFIAMPDSADNDIKDKATKKLADVQAKLKIKDADFESLAKSSSDEQVSAAQGGVIGWLGEAQMRPEIRVSVVGLAKGAISEPVKATDGWHILKLLDTKPAAALPFESVRDALAARLRAQNAEANRRAHLAKLLEQSPPTINELALSQVLDQPKVEEQAKKPTTPR